MVSQFVFGEVGDIFFKMLLRSNSCLQELKHDVRYIQLAQDRVQWREIYHMILNFWVPEAGFSFIN
jgi:hypothetical protein